jgi:osmotically-inducible protein OsmY
MTIAPGMAFAVWVGRETIMKATLTALFATIALLVAPSVASAQMTLKDRAVFDKIVEQVNRYTQFTVFDSISASVEDGRVVLSGWVTMPYKRDDIERRVQKVDGVETVENGIGVLPVSIFDDQLRFRIARAIYGNSSFWHYASMVNPPIHIVVNRGRVTLEGVVNSNVERMLARSLATGFGEFEVKNLLQTDAEVRESLAAASTAMEPLAR